MLQIAVRRKQTGRLVVRCIFLLAVAAVLTTSSSLASVSGSLYLDRPEGGSLVLEMLHPHFPGSNLSITTVGAFVTVRMPLSDRMKFVIDVPYATLSSGESGPWDYHRSYLRENGSAVGNVYLGIEIPSDVGGTTVDLGIRLPTASDKQNRASIVGQATDLDRPASYDRCLGAAVSLVVVNRNRRPSGLETTFLISPLLLVPAGRCGGMPTFLLQYGASWGVVAQRLTIRAGLTGRMSAVRCGASICERTIHHCGVNISYNAGTWRPGAGIRVRLDNVPYDNGHDYALGLNLVYAFR